MLGKRVNAALAPRPPPAPLPVPRTSWPFCPSHRLRHASRIAVAGDDPVNEGDPDGMCRDVINGASDGGELCENDP